MIKYIILAVSLLLIGCGGGDKKEIKIDGSSTVYPIMEKMAEKYNAQFPNERPTIGISGTGGGFKKFTVGEIDIVNASRPIEQLEIDKAKANNIEFIEIPLAIDGLTVAVNKENKFAQQLTVEELNKIWSMDSKITNWNQVNPEFPNMPIKLYGPGTDSGTFDFFTKVINGKEKSSRSDYQASEDDNTSIQGLIGEQNALGYFGYVYYLQNKDNLTAVKIYNEKLKTYVEPTYETIISGKYIPLSRPVFIYVNKKSLEKPEVAKFVQFVLDNNFELTKELGYVPMDAKVMEVVKKRVANKITGTMVHGIEDDIITSILTSKK